MTDTNQTETLLDDAIPEKFKDPQSGNIRTEELLRSYKALEKKLSSQPSVPKTPQEYCIECDHGMFEPDADINQRLHEKGFTNDQAQELYNLAAEKMAPMVSDISRDVQADREVEKLITHFGGAEQWKEVSRQLLAFGQKNMPEDVLGNLSSSFEGVLALHRMMKSDEPGLKKEASIQGAIGEQDLQTMMRDPRYWREKDPSFVSKVTEGFQNVYGK